MSLSLFKISQSGMVSLEVIILDSKHCTFLKTLGIEHNLRWPEECTAPRVIKEQAPSGC